jgi:hypothetical protein
VEIPAVFSPSTALRAFHFGSLIDPRPDWPVDLKNVEESGQCIIFAV